MIYILQFLTRAVGQSATLLSPLSEHVSAVAQFLYFPGAVFGLWLFGLKVLGSRLRMAVFLALMILGVSVACMDLAYSPLLFAAGRFLQGLAMGVFRVAIAVLAEHQYSRQEVVWAQHLLNRVNAITGPLIVLAAGFTTPRNIAVIQLLFILAAIMAIFGIRQVPEEAQQWHKPPGTQFLPKVFFGSALYLTWLALFWTLAAGRYTQRAGLQFLVEAGVYAVFGGIIVRRLIPRWRLRWGVYPLLGTLALFIGMRLPEPYWLICVAVFGASHAPVYPNLQRWIPRHDPHLMVRGQRLLVLGSDLGQAAGLAAGYLFKAVPTAVVGLMSALSILGLLFSEPGGSQDETGSA